MAVSRDSAPDSSGDAGLALRVRSLNWIMALVVMLSGWVIATFVMTFPFYFIVAAIMALVLAMLLARNLQFGLFGYMFIAALAFGESPGVQSPNSGYRAGLMPSEVLIAFLSMLWLGRAVFSRNVRLARSELNLPLIVLGVCSILSFAASNILRGTREQMFHQLPITQVAEVGLLWLSIIAFFLSANIWNDRKWLQALIVPVVVLGLYHAAHEIAQFPFPIPMVWGAFLLASAIAFVYSRLLFANPDRTQKILLTVLLIIMLVAMTRSLAWLSGVIAVGVAIMIVTAYRSRAAAVGLLLLGLFVLFVWPGMYYSIHEESAQGGDFDRFTIWRDAFGMFMSVSPAFGVGPGNYHPFVYYHNTIWFGRQTYTTAHSNYVQMASELGLIGLAAFLWVIISGIRTGHRAVRGSPPELKWLAVSAMAVFASMAVASVFGDYLFPSRGNNGIVNFGTTVYVWLIMGAAVAAMNLPREAE
jgi:O-antigen ligase